MNLLASNLKLDLRSILVYMENHKHIDRYALEKNNK